MEELKNNSVVEEDNEGTVVVITDEEGNEYNYVEEMVFDAGSDKYAILVSIDGDEECECHEHDEECGCEEEVDVILAKIVKDEMVKLNILNQQMKNLKLLNKLMKN